jgi:hypothetical protein
MGGAGSGRFGERRRARYVDDCDVLCVHDLKRNGFLQTGATVMGGLRVGHGVRVFVEVKATADGRGQLRVGTQTIALSASPGTKGGRCWFMHCPQTGARVVKLYRHPRRHLFESRAAGSLTYRSRLQSEHEVAVLMLRKAVRRLAGSAVSITAAAHFEAIPRPSRQRWTTYERNLARAKAAQWRANCSWIRSIERMFPNRRREINKPA